MASPALTPRAPLGAPLHRAARAHRRRRASKTNVRARAYPGGGGLQSPRWFIPERDLDLGDVGDDVEDLQLALGVQKTDGIYGRDTAEAVEAWQVMNGLAPTGYFGPKSRAAFIMNSEPISGLAAPARLDLAMAPTSSAPPPPPSVVASPSHVPAYVPVYVPSQTARGVGVANGGGAPMMNVASTGGGGVVAALVVGAAVAYAASERAAADGFLGSAWRSFLGAIRGDVEDDAYYPPGRAGVAAAAAAAAAAEEEEARFRTRGMGGSFPLEYAYAANEPRAAAVSVDAYEYASARQPVMAASSGGGGGGGGWVGKDGFTKDAAEFVQPTILTPEAKAARLEELSTRFVDRRAKANGAGKESETIVVKPPTGDAAPPPPQKKKIYTVADFRTPAQAVEAAARVKAASNTSVSSVGPDGRIVPASSPSAMAKMAEYEKTMNATGAGGDVAKNAGAKNAAETPAAARTVPASSPSAMAKFMEYERAAEKAVKDAFANSGLDKGAIEFSKLFPKDLFAGKSFGKGLESEEMKKAALERELRDVAERTKNEMESWEAISEIAAAYEVDEKLLREVLKEGERLAEDGL